MKSPTPRQLALAAAVCLASFGAQAQTDVKVYGLVDVSVGSYKDVGSSVTRSMVESGKMSTSNYGFSGTEDLGGGLSALFKVEGFFKADTGAQGRGTTDTQFSKTAHVGLTHKDYGTLTLGRNTTALFLSTLSFNAFGDSYGYSPSIRHYYSSGTVSGDSGWSDSVAYSSPTWNGLRFGVANAAKEGSNGGNWSANVGYSAGPLAAALVVQDVKKDGVNPATGAADTADTRTTQLGLSYDFGVAKAFAQYGVVKNRTSDKDYDIAGLGVRVPAGRGAVIAQWGKVQTDASNSDRNTYSVGYLYPLSKLTELYATAMHDEKEGSSNGHGYAAGMRLRF